MSKNGPGRSDKGKGKAPRRPREDEEETPEERDRPLKPYRCPKCGRRYTSKGHMTRHAKGSHSIDYTGPDVVEWDTLERFEFSAQQAAAQQRKRNNRAARRAAEAEHQVHSGPGLQSRAAGVLQGWEKVFVSNSSDAQGIPTIRGKRTVRDTAEAVHETGTQTMRLPLEAVVMPRRAVTTTSTQTMRLPLKVTVAPLRTTTITATDAGPRIITQDASTDTYGEDTAAVPLRNDAFQSTSTAVGSLPGRARLGAPDRLDQEQITSAPVKPTRPSSLSLPFTFLPDGNVKIRPSNLIHPYFRNLINTLLQDRPRDSAHDLLHKLHHRYIMSEEEWRLIFIVIVAMIASRRGAAELTMEATKTASFDDPRSLRAHLNHLILRSRIEQLRSSGAIRMGQGHGPMGDPRIHVVPEGAPAAGHPGGPSTSAAQESPASPSPPVSPRPGTSGNPETPARGLFPDSPPAKRAHYEDVSPVEQESSD